MFFICALFRKIFRFLNHDQHQDIDRILLDNLGAFISTNATPPLQSRAERILQVTILLASMILTMMVSAVLFGNLLTKNTQGGIDTLKEFADSNLRLFITYELNDTIHIWAQDLE